MLFGAGDSSPAYACGLDQFNSSPQQYAGACGGAELFAAGTDAEPTPLAGKTEVACPDPPPQICLTEQIVSAVGGCCALQITVSQAADQLNAGMTPSGEALLDASSFALMDSWGTL